MTTLEWSLNHSRARVRLRYRGSDTLNYGPYNTFDLASNIYSTPLQQQNIHNYNLITGKICGNLIQNYDFTNIPCYMEMEKPQTTNLQRKIKSKQNISGNLKYACFYIALFKHVSTVRSSFKIHNINANKRNINSGVCVIVLPYLCRFLF